MLPYTSIPLGSVLVCSLFVAWREEGGGGGGTGGGAGVEMLQGKVESRDGEVADADGVGRDVWAL